MVNNATPPQFTLTVGGLDISELVRDGGISLRQQQVSIANAIVWRGDIAIAETVKWRNSGGESLDNIQNPSRWARGNQPVVLTIAGQLFATLRISGYTYDYRTQTAQIQVTQLLDLLDYKTPPEDYRVISSNNTNVTPALVAARLLSAAGIPSFDLSDITSNDGIPPPDRSNRSYIGLAQEVLGERRYWLYHAPDETVKAVRYDREAIASFERSDCQCLELNPLPPRDIIPSLYRVTGGGDIYAVDCALSESINETEDIYGDSVRESGYWYKGEFVATKTSISRKVVERITTTVVTDEPNLIQIQQTGRKDLSLVTESGKERDYSLRKTYDTIDTQIFDNQGRLTKQTKVTNGIAFGRFPDTTYDLDPDALEFIDNLETETIEYSHDPTALDSYNGYQSRRRFDTNVLRIKVTSRTKKFVEPVIRNGSVAYELFDAPIEKIVETWIEKCPDNPESTFNYSRKVFKRDPVYNYAKSVPSLVRTTELFLDSTLSKTDGNATPPSWSLRPPLFPRTRAKLNVELARNYPGAEFDLIEKREQNYSAKSITTNAAAWSLAELLADTAIGKAFGYEVVLSLREAVEYLANPTPLQIARVHDREVLLDSPSLVIAGNEAEIAWEAIALRTLSEPIGGATIPVSSELSPATISVPLTFTAQLQIRVEEFNLSGVPDLSLIEVDSEGDVVTSGGYVQASANQNQFAQIVVATDGSILVSADGDVVTSAKDVYDPAIWDSILTMNGEVVTMNGEVVTA